jgi:succinate dehydrogenase flavin-adding protein (antitoxin of CptAB toxin-antitoxin module)
MGIEDNRLKRLIFRSAHRGCKETDLLLGDFAAVNLAHMPKEQIDLYEAFIEEPDWDIWAWVTGGEGFPPRYAPLIARLRERA